MHKIKYMILVAVLTCTATFSGLYAQDKGIAFVQGTLDGAVAEAAATGKLVFADCYTSWCGPCKMLARDVFTNDTVAAFFNRHFVSVKIDMEKADGPDIGRRYQVKAYPTLLFIDPASREVVYRLTGARRDAAWLVDAGRKALDPSANLVGLAAAYSSNRQDTTAVARYMAALTAASLTAGADSVMDEYLGALTDANRLSAPTWKLLERYVRNPYSTRFDYMLAHADGFAATVGQERVADKLHDVYRHAVMKLIKRRRVPEEQLPRQHLDRLAHLLKDYRGADAAFLRAETAMIDCAQRADYRTMMDNLDRCCKDGTLDRPDTRFYFVWLNLTYLCEASDRKALKRGMAWMERLQPQMTDPQMHGVWLSMKGKLEKRLAK